MIEAFDSAGRRSRRRSCATRPTTRVTADDSLMEILSKRAGADGSRSCGPDVEARAFGQEAEAIRGAALLLGWTLRLDATLPTGSVPAYDLDREAFMRGGSRAAGGAGARVAPWGLLPRSGAARTSESLGRSRPLSPRHARRSRLRCCIFVSAGYDSRSGYRPASATRLAATRRRRARGSRSRRGASGSAITDVARAVRAARHTASFPDAREAARLAMDLAALRGLGTPSRRELLEGIEAAMCQGETMGRGRVVARALSAVMVGERRGVLADLTPRSGLAPHVEALFRAFGFPGPSDPASKELSLDPLRSPLDRRREIALARLEAAGIVYGERIAAGPRRRNRRDRLSLALKWSPSTAATIELDSLFGATLIEVARGKLRHLRARALEGGSAAVAWRSSTRLEAAARCGLADLVVESAVGLAGGALTDARFLGYVCARTRCGRIAAGHFAALPSNEDDAVPEAPSFAPTSRCPNARWPEALVQKPRRPEWLDRRRGSMACASCVTHRCAQGSANRALNQRR